MADFDTKTMCTVTFMPLGAGDFILTSNRDEHFSRSPQHISRTQRNEVELLFPRDSGAGGSWIAISAKGWLACLLNGAFEKHQHRPPYRVSRGILLMDSFDYAEPYTFFYAYDLEGIEPFTLLLIREGGLWECRWDGALRHFRQLSFDEPHIWSSATLYPAAMREKREGWFRSWLSHTDSISPESILDLHLKGGEGDPFNDFVMNREGKVQTVSITQVIRFGGLLEMQYHDLLREQRSVETVSIEY